MTEVVTPTAAYVQPLLYAARQQAFGVPAPDSSQSELATALAATQQQQALDATQVASTSDQPALRNDDSDARQPNQSFLSQLPTPAPQPKAPDAPTGPAKARVELSVLDITAAAAAPGQASVIARQNPLAASSVSSAPAPSVKPLTLSDLGGGPAGPAQAPANLPDVPDTTGVLGPAAVVKDSDLANIAQNIFGAAFAPTQVVQPTADPAAAQTQKNFIFAHRKLFADEAERAQASSGKFASEETKAAAFGTELATGKFAVQPVAVAAATVGAQFAASAESAHKLFDKIQVATAPSVDATTGETRLYDKVAQSDTQNQGGQSGYNGSADQSLDSRQSLYQRAQAVAQALGEKSANPAVKKLVATLESYATIAGVGDQPAVRRTVRVTV